MDVEKLTVFLKLIGYKIRVHSFSLSWLKISSKFKIVQNCAKLCIPQFGRAKIVRCITKSWNISCSSMEKPNLIPSVRISVFCEEKSSALNRNVYEQCKKLTKFFKKIMIWSIVQFSIQKSMIKKLVLGWLKPNFSLFAQLLKDFWGDLNFSWSWVQVFQMILELKCWGMDPCLLRQK